MHHSSSGNGATVSVRSWLLRVDDVLFDGGEAPGSSLLTCWRLLSLTPCGLVMILRGDWQIEDVRVLPPCTFQFVVFVAARGVSIHIARWYKTCGIVNTKEQANGSYCEWVNHAKNMAPHFVPKCKLFRFGPSTDSHPVIKTQGHVVETGCY